MVQAISAERTLVLPEYNGQTAGLSWPLVWPAKDPGESNIDYSLDISGWLNEIQDTIGSLNVNWGPDGTGDLAVNSAFSHNSVLTALVSAGNAYVTYDVTFTVKSATLGETMVRTIQLPVEPRMADAGSGGSVSGVVQ